MGNPKGAGRKKVDNKSALESCIANPKSREALIFELKRLTVEKESMDNRSKQFGEDVKGSAEVFGFSKGYFSQLIKDVLHGDLEKVIGEKTAYVDVLEVVKEQLK